MKYPLIFCGNGTTFFVTSFGVWACGRNDFGQLGLGSKKDIVTNPTNITRLNGKKISRIIVGKCHNIFVVKTFPKNLGVWCCGSNKNSRFPYLNVAMQDEKYTSPICTDIIFDDKYLIYCVGDNTCFYKEGYYGFIGRGRCAKVFVNAFNFKFFHKNTNNFINKWSKFSDSIVFFDKNKRNEFHLYKNGEINSFHLSISWKRIIDRKSSEYVIYQGNNDKICLLSHSKSNCCILDITYILSPISCKSDLIQVRGCRDFLIAKNTEQPDRYWYVQLRNDDGRLLAVEQMTAREIKVPSGIEKAYSGANHVIVISKAGRYYGVGDNTYGQFGFMSAKKVDPSFPSFISHKFLYQADRMKFIAKSNYLKKGNIISTFLTSFD